jgi:putative Mn2+ efflux pump MntP
MRRGLTDPGPERRRRRWNGGPSPMSDDRPMVGLVLAAAALGLDNFGAAIAIGLSGVNARIRIRVALVFGLFEAAMPLIGLVVGRHLSSSLGSATSYIGGGLLVATGAFTVFEATRNDNSEREPVTAHLGRLVLTGAALSIDNLVVGFALGTRTVPVVASALIIAVVSVGMSVVGLELGDRLGDMTERWAEEIGGFVLIVVGIAIAAKIL